MESHPYPSVHEIDIAMNANILLNLVLSMGKSIKSSPLILSIGKPIDAAVLR